MVRYLALTLIWVLPSCHLCATEGEFVVDRHTRLLCHFDTSVDADYAKGESHHSEHTIVTRGGQGRFGEAALLVDDLTPHSLVPAGGGITFDVKDNLPSDAEGTIEFWLKIAKLSRVARNRFFSCGEHNAQRMIVFCDPNKKDFAKSRLWFWVNNNPDFKKGTGYLAVGCLIKPLLDGKWHHVAACWDREHAYLFVDGRVQSKARRQITFPIPTEGKMSFSHPRSRTEWLLDELRISDICRYRGQSVDRAEGKEPKQ